MQTNVAESNLNETESQTVVKREMSGKRLIGDGVGAFGANIFQIGFYGILLYFYTDVAGIASGLIGTLILASRVLDGITDVLFGGLIDRTQSKHGKARPWILWLTIPTGLVAIALFYVPDIGSIGQNIYILITNALFFSVGCTGIQIAYTSLMALTTRNPYDRSLMGIVRGVFGFLGGMVISVAFIPIVNALGNDQKSWSMMITIFSILACIALLIAFKSTKETTSSPEKVDKERQVPLINKLKALLKNKYLVLLLIIQICATVLSGISASANIYYVQYIWQNLNLIAVIGAIGLFPMIIGFAVMAPSVKRLGKRNVVIIGAAITILGNLIRLIDLYNVPIGIAGIFISSLGMVPTMALLFPMVSDSIEYGEWKTGLRMEGLVTGSMNITMKIGNGLGTAGIGWLLALGGYVAGKEIQSALANQMIIAVNIYIPILVSLIIIVILAFYKLDKEYSQIVTELDSKKSN